MAPERARHKMPGEFEYVNNYYGLNLKRGTRLKFTEKSGEHTRGKGGTVAKGDGQHIMILVDGDLKPTGPFHPTWEIQYDPEPVAKQGE
jgi:hypothetical protein